MRSGSGALSTRGTNLNFISDLLSVVFAEYTELIRLFEKVCLIKVALRQCCPLWCSGLDAGLVAYSR